MGESCLHALSDVSFTIAEGEFAAIVGASGSGKTTLMNIIGCLDTATKGEYFLDGRRISSLSQNELSVIRNEKIGFVFQGFNLIPTLTAAENVELPLIYRKMRRSERTELVKSALEMVGLSARAEHKPNQLSGGQQQRVALARTLNQNPTIILADEPVAALDPVTAHQVMGDFKRINEEMNISILINIHHVDLALKYATRVIGIRAGEIVYDGPTTDVTQEILDQIYNGASIPQAGE